MNKKIYKPLTRNSKRKAFSLIELSIVLIIIGLLVAGVTGGASLIRNAELRSVMNEARGYATAVNSFYTKFNALPGDFNSVIGTMNPAASTTIGNANGLIEFYGAHATSTTVTGRMEGNIALQHLTQGGFIDNNFTPATGSSGASGVPDMVALTPGSNIPGSKFKNAGWVFDYISGNTQNVVTLTAAVAVATGGTATLTAQNFVPTPIITPIDALAIDTKTDDGVANAGKVRASGDDDGTYTTGVNEGNGFSTCNTTATYATATTTATCGLTFQVDPNS